MARQKIIGSQQSKSLDTLMGEKEEKVSLFFSLLVGTERGPGSIYREEEGNTLKWSVLLGDVEEYCLLQGMVGNRRAQREYLFRGIFKRNQ